MFDICYTPDWPRQTTGFTMITADKFKPGDTVRDKKLGLIWTVVGRDEHGQLRLQRNDVEITASADDVELIQPTF
jgi:hypothetical protein